MANSSAGAAAVSAPTASGSSGAQNPFQIATNLYAEANVQAQYNGNVPSSPSQQGGSVNAGQYLRGVRILVRTTTTGTSSSGNAAPGLFDMPYAAISSADLVNVDGSEILYNMSAYAHTRVQKYFRPWLQDPDTAYDTYVSSATACTGVSFTLFLQPEVRFTAGVLANTDTRSQYRIDYTLAALGTGTGTGPWGTFGTGNTPALSVLPYMDAWAQPDGNDLQGTANQPVPPGVNLQNKRRHQIFSGLSSGDNTLLSTLTGNALRGMLFIFRNTSSVRVDAVTSNTNIYWQLDNRSLGKLNNDIVRQWAADFYSPLDRGGASSTYGGAGSVNVSSLSSTSSTGLVDLDSFSGNYYAGSGSFDTGVYVFPRWIEPGNLEGQGWLYTANSTKLQWEFTSLVSAVASGTAELVTDEIYPVGSVDPSLIDI